MSTDQSLGIWVIADAIDEATFERLGDARAVADRLKLRVGLLLASPDDADDQAAIQRGADHVCHLPAPGTAPGTAPGIAPGTAALIGAAQQALAPHRPRLILAPGTVRGREWAAGLAAAEGWSLISPALMIQVRAGRLEVTALDRTGRRNRSVMLDAGATAVVTLRPGVAEALAPDLARRGTSERLAPSRAAAASSPDPITFERLIPADPATVDIRLARRLISGGRGLGSKEGFDALRRFAAKLDAGVAASRMAVDLGWIDHARQVGQTGKTVHPELYIACGISGASHHLEGMGEAKHIIAINTDPQAPIFKLAHLGLVADLYATLKLAEEGLKP